ncbi:hypothetical protein A3D06_02355 [Candidatus Roizmanbacteria bacterium RIFCSPHIGHO2_02_FULL_40_9]|uniref:UDP-N-acetyl-alpha-D-muramoyl-L-alanyl-L-glutamate epimerase n=1 Tax=Candidatus Roizmanbacteria bacterium RIFCSPHIGHO2_02_FULL_40_9 TaxID=1802042 RepID=A0A1F7HCU4_9BACT|nr:MAG: hypothetical protein A3D06_02355 [Candidatus Roizmanbacteria bacterium RIFCSPHIGHO2_02_FULL_40_9]
MFTEFEFTDYEAHWSKGELVFHYAAFSQNRDKVIRFQEKLILPSTDFVLNPKEFDLDEMLKCLHLVIGASYYKFYCTKVISIPSYALSEKQARFWNTVYEKGLGEYFYKNNIDYRDLIFFPFSDNYSPNNPQQYNRLSGSLISVGGGKDSLLSIELIRKSDEPIALLYSHVLHEESVKAANLPSFKITRELDQKVFDKEFLKTVYNGHIPITGIFSCMSVLFCILYGKKYSIFSNERSSDYGNIDYLGSEINHQWSKSFEFENLLRAYIKEYISPDVEYFSLLRPLYEIEIIRRFVTFKQYLPIFKSCNRNYKLNSTSPIGWCGECPKCAFVFSLMCAFMPVAEVSSIFNKNLFEDGQLIGLFRELLGLEEAKPFECVGRPEEVQMALYYVFKRNDFRTSPIISLFEKEILPTFNRTAIESDVFSYGDDSNIPEKFKILLKEHDA